MAFLLPPFTGSTESGAGKAALGKEGTIHLPLQLPLILPDQLS